MKTGDKVNTPLGIGEIIMQESIKGALTERYCVKLESCPDELIYMQSENGGVYFWKDELFKERRV